MMTFYSICLLKRLGKQTLVKTTVNAEQRVQMLSKKREEISRNNLKHSSPTNTECLTLEISVAVVANHTAEQDPLSS